MSWSLLLLLLQLPDETKINRIFILVWIEHWTKWKWMKFIVNSESTWDSRKIRWKLRYDNILLNWILSSLANHILINDFVSREESWLSVRWNIFDVCIVLVVEILKAINISCQILIWRYSNRAFNESVKTYYQIVNIFVWNCNKFFLKKNITWNICLKRSSIFHEIYFQLLVFGERNVERFPSAFRCC